MVRPVSAEPGFQERLRALRRHHEKIVHRENEPEPLDNGIVTRYRYPVLTADHVPLSWRYDLDPQSNPLLQERLGINAVFNPGAIYHGGRYLLVTRTEGLDRKSFFAVAESANGVDGFRFRDEPIVMPETDDPDVNVYDMRVTPHEDGWIYGLFCTERKDPEAEAGDLSAAIAQCGIARTRDLVTWERLPDLRTPSAQQRNVVLHPELVGGRYLLYTRPQDAFISAGTGGGIGWAFCDDMTNAVVDREEILDPREYHTIKEVKNGEGPPPIRTREGWLHLAHGVRIAASGLRYVLYMYLADLDDPCRVIAAPAGHFLSPSGEERIGDTSNVLFSNGWIVNERNEVFIYYASSDTRTHVATSTVERLVDYVLHTPEDPGRSAGAARLRVEMIRRNEALDRRSG